MPFIEDAEYSELLKFKTLYQQASQSSFVCDLYDLIKAIETSAWFPLDKLEILHTCKIDCFDGQRIILLKDLSEHEDKDFRVEADIGNSIVTLGYIDSTYPEGFIIYDEIFEDIPFTQAQTIYIKDANK